MEGFTTTKSSLGGSMPMARSRPGGRPARVSGAAAGGAAARVVGDVGGDDGADARARRGGEGVAHGYGVVDDLPPVLPRDRLEMVGVLGGQRRIAVRRDVN